MSVFPENSNGRDFWVRWKGLVALIVFVSWLVAIRQLETLQVVHFFTNPLKGKLVFFSFSSSLTLVLTLILFILCNEATTAPLLLPLLKPKTLGRDHLEDPNRTSSSSQSPLSIDPSLVKFLSPSYFQSPSLSVRFRFDLDLFFSFAF